MLTDWRAKSLEYHRTPRPGKVSITLTKPLETVEDLSLAYSPGVASPCMEINANPEKVFDYTNKGNLIGIVSNGTAVLGLGDIGPMASKPVMEGKAMLFKKFADIDVFDIEIKTDTTERLIETIAAISPTFGGINIEDVKAPECFLVEERLHSLIDIPLMHDDQHGTAVIVCAGLLNALHVQGKNACDVKVVALGAGAAGIASLKLMKQFFSLKADQITLFDSKGMVSYSRDHIPDYKLAFARDEGDHTSLENAIRGADIVLGVSKADQLTPEMVKSMAPKPIIFALANPTPEIMPTIAHEVRDDVIIATGRSDFPNQVNNSICFPYLFRAALDIRAKQFTQKMFFAAIKAIAEVARTKPCEKETTTLLGGDGVEEFGPLYILPKQDDLRLRESVVPAVIDAAKSVSESADS